MIIEKEILSKIPRDYVFIVQTVKLDTAYFKKRIAEGVKNSSINYKTNVKGKHTDWNFFNNDKKFISIMMQMIDHLEKLPVPLASFRSISAKFSIKFPTVIFLFFVALPVSLISTMGITSSAAGVVRAVNSVIFLFATSFPLGSSLG